MVATSAFVSSAIAVVKNKEPTRASKCCPKPGIAPTENTWALHHDPIGVWIVNDPPPSPPLTIKPIDEIRLLRWHVYVLLKIGYHNRRTLWAQKTCRQMDRPPRISLRRQRSKRNFAIISRRVRYRLKLHSGRSQSESPTSSDGTNHIFGVRWKSQMETQSRWQKMARTQRNR